MNNSGEKSILTNPISEMLNHNSLGLEKDFPSDNSTKTNWGLLILGIIILGFFLFIIYQKYTGGETIYERFQDFHKYIKNWFKSMFGSSSSTAIQSQIGEHMEKDHYVEEKALEPPNPQKLQDENDKKQLDQSLNEATPNYRPEPGYNADDSYSSIQKSKSSSKSGWCYIGEDRGFRSCINVGENDKCMSGDIFPTSEICVNPNLRM